MKKSQLSYWNELKGARVQRFTAFISGLKYIWRLKRALNNLSSAKLLVFQNAVNFPLIVKYIDHQFPKLPDSVMVLKLRKYPHIIRTYVSLNRQYEKKLRLNYQKYLSSTVPLQQKHGFIRQKFDEFIAWYDNFTGMDEVRLAQNRVLEDEDNFRKFQEERRGVLQELTEIQQKLKDLYTELETTNRGDERFVILVTEEHKLLKAEKLILEKFARAEKLERESFAALSSSVKLSHEKERAQSERTKYWSIIGSVLGTIIGLLGSSVNNHFKMNELKQLIKSSTNIQLMECMTSYLEKNKEIMEKYRAAVKADEKNNVSNTVEIERLLNSINVRLNDLETSFKNVESISEKQAKVISAAGEDVIVTVPVATLEETLKKEYNQTKMLLYALAVLSVIVPIITKFS